MATFDQYRNDVDLLRADLALSEVFRPFIEKSEIEIITITYPDGTAAQAQAVKVSAMQNVLNKFLAGFGAANRALWDAICSHKGFDWCNKRNDNDVIRKLYKFLTGPAGKAFAIGLSAADLGILSGLLGLTPEALDAYCKCPKKP